MNPEGGTTSYVYDPLNRLTSLTDFNTQTFGFSCDAASNRRTCSKSLISPVPA